MINRSLHRWIGLPVALFLLWIGGTGVVLQIWQLNESHEGRRPAASAVAPADVDVVTAVARALAAAHHAAPALRPRQVTVDLSGPAIRVSVAASARNGTHVDFDAASGATRVVTDPPSLYHFIMDLHSGGIAGKAGNAVALVMGAGLVGLSITGFLVWLDMWRRRRKAGRRGLFWSR